MINLPSIFIRIISDAVERRAILLDVAMEGHDGDDREAKYHVGKLNDSLLSGGGEPLGSMGVVWRGLFLCRCAAGCSLQNQNVFHHPTYLGNTIDYSWESTISY